MDEEKKPVEAPKPDPSKGVDAGELGKAWKALFEAKKPAPTPGATVGVRG